MATQDTARRSSVEALDGSQGIADRSSENGLVPPRLGQVIQAEQGHLVLLLPPGGIINGSMAAGFADTIERLAVDGSLPMLLTLTGVESISRSARDVFGAVRCLAAVAVVGVSPVDRVIANFLLGGEVQPCPTRYFTGEDDALKWLSRYAA
ncbi:STAS/SEC14 domain-containing protein [Arthrobacter yangruifuii]|uniref:DUF7793 family protein n=1 Tax=Arthrobacter yangruifuii TaxID=2606616 RepID=UPI001FEF0643|nr:STAS/SEC14 domain-containing protein [Arthrobacter yangruifuii]